MRDVTTIHFDRDWNVAADGAIVAGTRVRVAYDAQRLPSPRPAIDHRPAWTITCCYRFDEGTDVHCAAMFGVGSNSRDGVLEIDVPPAAREIELWFYLSDRWGHRSWDSRYGENFRFPILAPDEAVHTATLRFNHDGSITVEHKRVAAA